MGRRRTELAATSRPSSLGTTGFDGYVGNNSLVKDCYPASAFDIDSDLAQHLKGLSRKHPSTKLKALASLSQLIRQKSSSKIANFMPQWAFIYKKLLLDYDRQVRQATHVTMVDLVSHLGRDLSPHLKTLIGPWWFSQFDSVHQVSQAAKRSFETAFPAPERRLYALMLCLTEIVTYIEENLNLIPQSLSDIAIATEELERMHQQVLSSSLLALAALLDALCHRHSVLMGDTKAKTVALTVDVSVVENLITTNNYFTDYLKSQSPVVRSAAYSLVKSCIKRIPHAINEGDLKLVAAAIFGSFQEKNPTCHSAMWGTLLVLTKTYPESWNTVSVQETILNPFWDFLKNGCFGSQQVSYPALILFLETVPQNAITGDKFFRDFFHNIWAGRNLSYSSNADRYAFFLAVEECFCWTLKNASRFSLREILERAPPDIHPHSKDGVPLNFLYIRYCDGVDAIYRFNRLLIDEILLGLLWHEYLVAVDSKNHNKICSSYNPSRGYEEIIGECIIKILSAVHCMQSDLLLVFYMKFQADCLDIFNLKKDNLPQKAHWVVRFLLLLDQHAVQKGETWPFDLVGPVLKAYFPLIQQLDSPDSVQLLQVAVSIFGPLKIVCIIRSTTDLGTENFLSSFSEFIVPWCLKVSSASTQARLDFLFTVLDEESFIKQWDAVIKHLYNSVTVCANNWKVDQVFVCLVKMARERTWEKTSDQYMYSKWHHQLLDLVAISLVRAIPPYESSYAQFISAVLGGGLEADKSFLSSSTQTLILEEVLHKLVLFMKDSSFVGVRDVCSLLVTGTSYSGCKVESSCNSSDMAYFALDILNGSTYCLNILEDDNEELTENILAAVFIIDWEYNLITMFEDELNEEQLGKANSRLASGAASHAFRCRVSDQLLKSFDVNRRKRLGTKLIESAKRAFSIDSSISTTTCCKWVLDIFRVLCVDLIEQQQLLDQLLSKNEWWPMWIMPDGESNTKTVTVQCVQASMNANFYVLIDELISKVGFDQLVARPWLAAEMLCTWNWVGGIALNSFLPWFTQSLNDREFSDQIINILLDGSIAHAVDCRNNGLNHLLWSASFEEIGSVEEPFLRALLSLLFIFLQDKVWEKEKTLSFFEQLLNKLHTGERTSINLNCLRILPSVLNILLRHLGTAQFQDPDPPNQTDFHHVIVDWLETTTNFPMLNNNAWQTGQDYMEDWLQLIITCFPIKVTETMFGLEPENYALPTERSLLYKLFQKHKVGGSCFDINKKCPLSVQRLLLKLMVISAAYYSKYFDGDDWIFILCFLSLWIRTAAEMMEEIAKNVNDIIQMSINGSDDVGDAGLLGKLKNTVIINDHNTIQLATYALEAFSKFRNLLALHRKKHPHKLVVERMESIENGISEGILRLLFATAAAEAIAVSSDHKEASSVIASSRLDHHRFWELVGLCAVHSSTITRERAMESMDGLKLSKGPISSLCALLFSGKPLAPLQSAAFDLLSTKPIVCYALSSSTDESAFCLRKEISCKLVRSHLYILRKDKDSLAKERVDVLVALGLMLSCLMSLTPSSVVSRESIIQYVQEITDSVILDFLFQQHIKCITGSTKKHIRLAGIAAKLAIKTGSALFAIKSLWPIEKKSMASLSCAIFGLMLLHLPSFVRRWFGELQQRGYPRGSSDLLELFIMSWCSPEFISNDFSRMKKYSLAMPAGNENIPVKVTKLAAIGEPILMNRLYSSLQDRAFRRVCNLTAATKEVVATYTMDETQMDLIIRYPPSYPLNPMIVSYKGSLGIRCEKLDEWLASFAFSVQNGRLNEAIIRIWKDNIDKEFEGVEECPICNVIIHAANQSHPNAACETCKHKFHWDCIIVWFSRSTKNTCPICRSLNSF